MIYLLTGGARVVLQYSMSKQNPFPNLTKTLHTGVLAGLISSAIGAFMGIVTQSVAATYYPETSVAAVSIAAISMSVIGSLVYYFLYLYVPRFARDVFTIIGLTVPTLITLSILSGYYEAAFRIIAVSVAYAVSLSTVILIPWLSERYKAHEHARGKKKGHAS